MCEEVGEIRQIELVEQLTVFDSSLGYGFTLGRSFTAFLLMLDVSASSWHWLVGAVIVALYRLFQAGVY